MSITVKIPDIGGAEGVDVIEIMVAVGDTVTEEQSLLTLEGDKATMEIPSPAAGVVKALSVKMGDKVSEGDAVMTLEAKDSAPTAEEALKKEAPLTKAPEAPEAPKPAAPVTAPTLQTNQPFYAGPSVRRIAHELDVDLAQVRGSGEKGRITVADVKGFLSQGSGAAGPRFAPAPLVDFSKFGEIETQPLSRIKKISGANLARNWASIPHVTQFDEADITEMDVFRKAHKAQAEKKGFKLTPLVFIMKAVVAALKAFPEVNSSLVGDNLVLKKYVHIGVAVDTPNGLVVPVIRDVDQKSLLELAEELGLISKKAREKGLSVKDMQGGCFTISSLGGIGGTAFTPIVNAPEAAILGVSKAFMKPVYQADGSFAPRLMLPLSLSYDHRIIDGALGARFAAFVASRLSDLKTLLL